MNEIWKPILGYELLYEVSTFGNIRSINSGLGIANKKDKILKCFTDKNGYSHIGLTDEFGNRKNKLIHRLVALTFIENIHNKKYINHIDGVKSNNDISNLEWVTQSENMKHCFEIGLQTPTKFWIGKTGINHHSSKRIICINDGLIYDSIISASEKYKLHRTAISAVCRGIQQSTGGLKFSYYPL